MTVFLGRTCNGSDWREKLKPLLEIDAFDPVVSEWNETAQQREISAREQSEFLLYVLTPKMTGFYSVAELMNDAHRNPERTLYCFLEEDGEARFTSHQIKSLKATGELVAETQARCFESLNEVASFLNGSQSRN